MERADQAVQARKRESAPHPVPGRVTKHSPGNIPLWGLLPSPGGSWYEKGHGGGGGDAPNVDCRFPSYPDGGEVRSWENGRAGSEPTPPLTPRPARRPPPHTLGRTTPGPCHEAKG